MYTNKLRKANNKLLHVKESGRIALAEKDK
jgi:hypothetical protein